MADLNERDAKLVQYLSEAYGKERELETTLEAHIAMTTRAPYKKRLREHLRETKAHAKGLDRRLKKLDGGTHRMQTAVGKVKAAAKGPMHMLRGSGEQEKMLKNAKTEYFNEHEEIATYLAIETLAEKVGDRETAQLARAIRREEERMAKFLSTQIKSLTGAVVVEEVPSAQRKGGASRKRSSSRRKSASRPSGRTAPRRTAKSPKRKTKAAKRPAKVAKRTAKSRGSRRTAAASRR